MPEQSPAAQLRAALGAAARGWPVFPLRPGDKRPALHSESRCPRIGECVNGHQVPEQRASTDPDRIRAAWATGRFNVGIATGPAGLLVVDLDLPKPGDSPGTLDGQTELTELGVRAGHDVPSTYTVCTPSGGWHLYFSVPAGLRLPSTKGMLAKKIDTRAWGGYVVAPGSIVGGRAYEVAHRAPVADAPAWLLLALKPAPKPAAPEIAVPRDASRRAQVALERERAAIEAAVEGEREATLFRAARSMGRFVAWGDIPRHVVEEAFQGAGEAVGLKSYECRSTLRSALDWSIRTARPAGAA
ncbi:bifunctional DNA primase/polymerase [Streptomyces sp. NPDC005065]|uniref:bifunctional DNA primase/polymerase n=1 Tax=Streptomyces sp. NPDC005065 TaxID=3154461 RepID=UPI00339E4AA3